MKPGTPGFSGDRLALARRARGLTAVSLAELVGVTPQAISQYEKSVHTPRPDVMVRISDALQFPPIFFTLPLPAPDPEPVFFRSLASTTARSRERAAAIYELVRQVVAWTAGLVEFPTPDVPNLSPSDPARLGDEEIEAAATIVRRHWGLGDGPISNVVWLLENRGILIARFPFDEATLDGFSQWPSVEGRPYVLLNADKGSAARSRFDAAHELAHLVLHRGHFPKAGADFTRIEAQAHRFAAAFLFPESAFSREVVALGLPSFLALKRRWVVSMGMMIKRAAHLGFIDEAEEQRLWRNYSSRGFRRGEPLDDELPIEEPRILPRAFDLLLSQRVLTREQVLAQLPFHRNEVERLANLATGYLNPETAPVVTLKPRAPVSSGDGPGGGTVVPFSRGSKS